MGNVQLWSLYRWRRILVHKSEYSQSRESFSRGRLFRQQRVGQQSRDPLCEERRDYSLFDRLSLRERHALQVGRGLGTSQLRSTDTAQPLNWSAILGKG